MTDLTGGIPVDESSVVRDVQEVDGIVRFIVDLDPTWKPGAALGDVAVQWTPHLIRPDKRWVLHVHLSKGAPRYVARRLTAAATAGYLVHVALPLESLYDHDVVEVLMATDAYVYVLESGGVVTKRRHHLAALADVGVPVDPDTRRRLASAAWERRDDGTDNQRGRRLEALLAFLLAQIKDFRIFSRNFRTETGEIDIVLQVDKFSGRCWNEPGVPFIHVESKNWKDPAGQPVVSLLIRRLQTSRGRVRLGLLFSVGGFTRDAEQEELRLSEGDLCVALFDADSMKAMIVAEDLDDFLEARIGLAMLR